jgi:NodT family efflux transporter outer membrane factor (OMF) lipoprotein
VRGVTETEIESNRPPRSREEHEEGQDGGFLLVFLRVLRDFAADRFSGPVRVRIGAAAAAALLSACAAPVTVPTLHGSVRSEWRDAAHEDGLGPAPDLDRWWRAFGDPGLDRVIERAYAQNLPLAQAQLRLRAARALQHKSAAQYRPQIGFHTFAQPDPNGSTSYFEVGFDALWEFGFFGRSDADARIAAADAQGADADAVAARVTLAAEVARNYLDLRAAQARAGLLDAIVAQRRAKLPLAAKLVALHLGTARDVERAEAEAALAEAEAAEPAASIVQSQEALAVLLGEDAPAADLLAAAPQPQLPPLAIGMAPADLLRTRPEIRKAELAVLRAAGDLGMARADLYPKLALGGSLTSSTRVAGDVDRPNKAIPAVGPLIQWALFDWGARRDAIDAREAALQAAVLGWRQSVLEGVAEAQGAMAQLERQQRRLAAAGAARAASERAAAGARTLRGLGLGDAVDEAAAAIAAAQAQLEAASALHDRNVAFVALYKSFGGTLPPLQPDPALAQRP